jgi:flagellar biosynthesis protein FliR
VSITADATWLIAVILVSLRLGSILLMSPLFNLFNLPLHVRVGFTLAIAAMLVCGIGTAHLGALPDTVAGLAQAATGELIIGSILAFAVFAGFAVFQFAGRVMDTQLGFGVAGLVDPSTRSQAPLLGMLLNLTAVITFFLVDAHHLLLRGLAYSLEHVPLGAPLRQILLDQVVAQFGAMFVFSAMLAAPVMIVTLLLDVSMAMMARTMPQMNVFIIGLPLKIFVGLVVLALSLSFLMPLFERVFSGIFAGWERVVAN